MIENLQYTLLPQGLKNSPAMFEWIVNVILGNGKGRGILSDIEDVNLEPEAAEEHLYSL